jgi:hypothetical protein
MTISKTISKTVFKFVFFMKWMYFTINRGFEWSHFSDLLIVGKVA